MKVIIFLCERFTRSGTITSVTCVFSVEESLYKYPLKKETLGIHHLQVCTYGRGGVGRVHFQKTGNRIPP